MTQTRNPNRRTALVARRTQPNNHRSNTRQQSDSRQSTPTRQRNALSRVVDEGHRFSPSPRTRGAQRAEEERLLAANEAAMNGPIDLERALTELVEQRHPAAVPAVPAAVPAVPVAVPAVPAPERRRPRAAPQAAPNPPAAPSVPVAGPHIRAPCVAGPASPVPPAPVVNLAIVQHGQAVSRAGSLRYLQTTVKEHIFPKFKFPDMDEDLSFSNDARSVCRQMATLVGVSDNDIEGWWNLTRKGVFETIKRLRNNSIKLLGNAFKGKFVSRCSLRCTLCSLIPIFLLLDRTCIRKYTRL